MSPTSYIRVIVIPSLWATVNCDFVSFCLSLKQNINVEQDKILGFIRTFHTGSHNTLHRLTHNGKFFYNMLWIKNSCILSTHSVCTFHVIITTCSLYFSSSMNTGWFLRFVSRIFRYYFRCSLLFCLEIEASLADTLLRHASYSALPIFIILSKDRQNLKFTIWSKLRRSMLSSRCQQRGLYVNV